MHSVAEAARLVIGRVPTLDAEIVHLDEARARVLAAEIIARRPLPGFDNSAMDGYAARSSELPATLPVVAEVAAGAMLVAPVPARSAVRILTGAPLPPELDTVVIQEEAALGSGGVALPASAPGDNIRRAGEDIAVGAKVIPRGARLNAWHLGVLAALGVHQVTVARAPRVALIATGDELVDVASVPRHGQLVDSSAHALAGLVAAAGGIATYLGIARDSTQEIADRLAAARDFDMIITTGGVSVGERDHVREAFDAAGIALQLYKVAMKPGKPFSFGLRGSTPVFGLPGNPVSTAVAFELFVRPALLAMQGASELERPRASVELMYGYRKAAGRAHYLRAHVSRVPDRGPASPHHRDYLVAQVHPKQGSAMLSPLVTCNALVEIPAEITDVPAGGFTHALLLETV
ncbi:MAG: gephyrin-like molybdotransferase Glp [Kofleriaceae bacterium]